MTDVRPGERQVAAPQQVSTEQVVDRPTAASAGLRVFQVLTAVAGGVLFVMGLVAIFRADFGAGMLEASAGVAGFAFSPVTAVAAVLLGGAILVASLADQDRGGSAFLGLVTLLAGVVALALEGEIDRSIGVDRRAALLFVGIGAVVFVLSLVPWWSLRRRRSTVVVR